MTISKSIFITGSADGLGLMAARLLVADGHRVVLHARNQKRADEALSHVPGAATAAVGDLSSISETKHVAEQVNMLGVFDAVIHNAGIGYRESRRIQTVDGLSHIFAVNSLAPVHSDMLDQQAETFGVHQLRHASKRRPELERFDLEYTFVGRFHCLRRF